MILHFKRFLRPGVLRRVGRPLLDQFFGQFRRELQGQGLSLPGPGTSDETYFTSLTELLSVPEGLPLGLSEALFAIKEMASPEGQEQLELAATDLGLAFGEGASREDMALQVWLADPRVLSRLHNQQRLRRLTTFEYFGTARPHAERPSFVPPDGSTLQKLHGVLDPWFARHHRGCNTTRIELYDFATPTRPAPGQYWFLIRHGDTFTRALKVEAQQTGILHYRPERDDVVVYCRLHDELRINARTKGERDLYLRAFGACGTEKSTSSETALTRWNRCA